GADNDASQAADEKAHQNSPQGDVAGPQDVLDKDGGADGAALTDADVLPAGGRCDKGHPDGQNDQLRSTKEDVRYVPVKGTVDHCDFEVVSAFDQVDENQDHQNREGKEKMG